MAIIKSNNLDLSKVTFSDVKADIHGRKIVYINLDGGKVTLQTPKMKAPNGIKRWRKKDAIDNKDDKFELELAFNGEDGTDKNSKEIRDFHTKLQEFDELVKQTVLDNNKNWLQMPKLDMNTLETVLYSPMVRVPKDQDGNELPYPSRVRVKVDRDLDASGNPSGRFLSNKKFKSDVMIFNEEKESLVFNEDTSESVIPKGSQFIGIIELVYISLSKTSISTKWKCIQGKVFKGEQGITGYSMIDDDEEEHQDQEHPTQTKDLDSETEIVLETQLGNLKVKEEPIEEEEEIEEEVEEEALEVKEEPLVSDSESEAEPEPVKKKSTRAKKV